MFFKRKPAQSLSNALAQENPSEAARLMRDQDFTLIESPEHSGGGKAALIVEVNGWPALVAFTSTEHAGAFAGAMPDMLQADGGIPAFVVTGKSMLENLPDDCGVLLNPETSECHVLQPAFVNKIRQNM